MKLDPRDLPDLWRMEADGLRAPWLNAASQAELLDQCADVLEAAFEAFDDEPLTIDEAAAESGYTGRHLRRLLADGKLRDAGGEGASRVRRGDLPRKGREPERPITAEDIVRGIV